MEKIGNRNRSLFQLCGLLKDPLDLADVNDLLEAPLCKKEVLAIIRQNKRVLSKE